jgi:serine/threonine protein phosphatase PrpC
MTPEQVETVLHKGFLLASQAILQRSLQEGIEAATDTADLMSTTAVVGYLDGDVLTLAGVGDSRAYLIRDGEAEQLTVDGDVRCAHLAAGAPPEAVRELGPDAQALYSCLGVCEVGPAGSLVCCPVRSLPQVHAWRLRPGDVVVLASDGLVEEGVFLEPHDLVRLVCEARLYEQELLALILDQPPLPAVELARTFVAAARARHRDASSWEPQGCGDDITCIVLIPRRLRRDP